MRGCIEKLIDRFSVQIATLQWWLVWRTPLCSRQTIRQMSTSVWIWGAKKASRHGWLKVDRGSVDNAQDAKSSEASAGDPLVENGGKK